MSNTVRETKMSYCDRQIFTSKNKVKTTWYIVKAVTDRKSVHEDIHILNINDNLTNNQQIISNSFKDRFLYTSGRVNCKTYNNSNPHRNYSISMEYLLHTCKTATQMLNMITHQRKKLKMLSDI